MFAKLLFKRILPTLVALAVLVLGGLWLYGFLGVKCGWVGVTDYPNLNTHEADVYISVFPKEVSMYDSMEALNAATGKEYSDRFIEECEDVSFLTGTVQSVRDVKVVKGKLDMSFVLADVKTVLGTVPVAMSRDVFDIDGIAPGRVLAMKAHISADLASDEVFTYHDK